MDIKKIQRTMEGKFNDFNEKFNKLVIGCLENECDLSIIKDVEVKIIHHVPYQTEFLLTTKRNGSIFEESFYYYTNWLHYPELVFDFLMFSALSRLDQKVRNNK